MAFGFNESTGLNLDTAGLLDIQIRESHSFDVQMQFFEPDGVTPTVLAGDWKMNIGNQMQLSLGSGLSISSNMLEISRDYILNTLANGVYQYDLRNNLPGNISIPVFYGRIFVNQNITPP